MTPTNEAGHGLPERALAAWTGKHRADAENRAFLAGYETCQSDMNATALALSRGVPADMVLVPVKPTEAMLDAMHESIRIRCDPNKRTADIKNDTDVWAAMLAAAPAAAGAQGEEYAACCDTPAYCSSVRRCTRMDSTPQPAAADGGVRERARELLAAELDAIRFPAMAAEIRDESGYNTLGAAMVRVVTRALEQALTQQPALSSRRQAGEPNGKLVGWWNGIMPDVTERSPYGPSVRWGADAENSGHDIPLYDGYNPIHYTTPPLSKFRELAAEWKARAREARREAEEETSEVMYYANRHEAAAYSGCAYALLALVEKGAGNG